MSVVDHFLAKNFGQYVLVLEKELEKDGITAIQQASIHANIARAQFELGLNRKAIKSSQSCIDLHNACADSSMDGTSFLRACITKSKALLASGKRQDAIRTLTVDCNVTGIDELYADIGLLVEIRSQLVEMKGEDCGTDALAPAVPVAHRTIAPCVAVAAPPLPAQGLPIPSVPPTATQVAKPVPASVPTTTTTPATSQATQSPKSDTAKPSGVSKASAAQAGALNDPKAVFRAALTSLHKRSIGDTDKHAIKPYFLQAIRPNLPHVTGEALVDDLVCLAVINVNGGNFDAASGMFKLLNQYRDDLPSAHIGAGSIAAMQRNFDEAIVHFSESIHIDPSIADAWKRRGQTRAAQGKTSEAIGDLDKAIALQPADADCYNQRGQVYHQRRNYARALADFRAALERGMSTAPLLNNIGMCEGQLGQVDLSIEAHSKAVKLDANFKEAHLNIALMHKEIGRWREALPFFNNAMKVESKVPFFQANSHRGLMYSQLGMPALSLQDLIAAINTLFSIVVGGGAGAGVTHTAEERVTRRGDLVQNLVRAAMCYQTVGQYNKTIGYLDQALSLQPGHNCWFQREIAMFLWASLDVDLVLYNVDDRVDPRLKDGWCKHVAWNEYMASQMATSAPPVKELNRIAVSTGGTGPYTPQQKPSSVPCLGRYSAAIPVDEDGELIPPPPSYVSETKTGGATAKLNSKSSESAVPVPAMRDEAQKLRLVELTLPMAQWVQLDSPGFLPNRRQHRMFGLSVLQMGAALTKHFSLIGLEGIGLSVPDAASSRPRTNTGSPRAAAGGAGRSSGGKAAAKKGTSSSSSGGGGSSSRSDSPSGKRGAGASTHTFNWRDLFDIGVRWRQVSEPGDPVWWIDRFPTQAFEEGFGLQTPLVNGHLTTVRYAPYCQPAFDRVKEVLLTDGYYTTKDVFVRIENEHTRQWLAEAETLQQLWYAVEHNFYVVVPCPSLKSPGKVVMEGTRLTLLTHGLAKGGVDFTIRTPGKPHRWSQYAEELEACFHRLEETFLWMHQSQSCCASEACAHRPRADPSDTSPATLPSAAPALPFGASSLDEVVLRPALELFYLWATFAPLSRGTAACGYAAFCGVLLAFGKKIATASLLPAGKQLDWEAILAVDFEDFWARTKGWFKLTSAGDLLDVIAHPWREGAGEGDGPSSPISAFGSTGGGAGGGEVKDEGVFTCVKTLRDMLDVMCLPYKS